MENLPKALVEVHLLRWIVTYPVDKVIHSLNNWRLQATDDWAFNIDRGNVNTVRVFLDFKKAFDTVDHDILVSKMNLYGIQRTALDWSQGTIRLAPFYFLY